MKKLKWLVLALCVVLGMSAFAIACGNDDKDNKKPTVAVNTIALVGETRIYEGATAPITAAINPTDANEELTWKSSDETIVTVTSKGLKYGMARLTGVKPGVATVTVTSKGGKKSECEVTVAEKLPIYYYFRGENKAGLFDWNPAKHRADMKDMGAELLKPSEANENILETKIDLYEGQYFKLDRILDDDDTEEQWAWKYQVRGNDNFEEPDYTIGGEKVESELKVQMGDAPQQSLKVGVSGKYEIKLDISDEANVKLTYKWVEEATEVAEVVYDLYLRGNVIADDWPQVTEQGVEGVSYFTKEGNVHTLTVDLKADDEFKICNLNDKGNGGWGWSLGRAAITDPGDEIAAEGDNIKIVTPGTYTFTVTMNGDVGTITYTVK